MPWWKNSNSPSSSSSSPRSSASSPSSPRRSRRELNLIWSRQYGQPRLTRQRKLRHLTDIDVGAPADSAPVSRSRSSFDCVAANSPSSPQPLPLPQRSSVSPHRESGLGLEFSHSNLGGCPLPSPKGVSSRGGLEEGNDAADSSSGAEVIGEKVSSISVVGSRLAYQIPRKSPEHGDAPAGGSTFSHYRKVLQDPNAVDTVNFRLNIPAKSAPTSSFSSPVLSPRRLSNVEFFPSAYPAPQGLQVWSAPEIPSTDMMISSQTSPEKILVSPDRSPLYSPKKKGPVLRSRNPSAPPSPLHPKMFPENSVAWHDSNGNVNVHPLPLPPGAAVPSQSGFVHQTVAKTEVSPITNQWQKGKLIGSGTFGNVYVASNRHTGALCAMKEVNLIPDDPKSAECLKQLEQEIKVLSQLKHPNIVQYYGSEMIEDRFFIYLEYVHPGSINKYVREHCGAMTESVVRNFTRHILNGLAYLHSKNTMHRDIKGANLLVNSSGVVKLADFGMAKHLSGAASALSLKGTPYWMAPEVLQATLNKDIGYDLSVDIWSLGCTIIEMFTGKHPWMGLEGPAAMFKVLHKSPEIPETLSSEGKDFLRLCFRRNPADRPTASMLLEHPFIRNSHHHNLHGSIQAFAAIKLVDTRSSPRERRQSKIDSGMKGKQLSNGEASQSHSETSESAASRLSPRSTLEALPSLSPPHANHVAPGSAISSPSVLNGMHLYTLPRIHDKEVLKLYRFSCLDINSGM